MAASVQLVKKSKFPLKFTRFEDSTDPIGGGAAAEVLECKLDIMEIEIRSTDVLLSQIEKEKGLFCDPKLTENLQQVLKKALAIRSEVKSDRISASIQLNYLNSLGIVKTEICLSGSFLSNVSAECKLPIFAALEFKIFISGKDEEGDDYEPFRFLFKEVSSPSLTEQGDCVFKFGGECCKIITVDTKYKGCLSIDLRVKSPVSYWSSGRRCLPSVLGMNESILTKQIESDFELVAENGKRFPCHKVFLAVNSDVLARMLQTDCEETKKKQYKMTNMSDEGVKAFLDFIYCAQVDKSVQNSGCALELLEAANKFDVDELHCAIRGVFLNQSIEWMHVDVAVMLYLYTIRVDGNEELKWKAIQTLKSKPDELMKSEPFDELWRKDPSTAKEIIRLAMKTGSASEAALGEKFKR